MSIAFGRWEERAPVGGACAGGGRARAGGEKKGVAFSRRPVAQWD